MNEDPKNKQQESVTTKILVDTNHKSHTGMCLLFLILGALLGVGGSVIFYKCWTARNDSCGCAHAQQRDQPRS